MKTLRNSAFTLVEMLSVLGIIVVMMAVIVPAAIQTLRGSNLTQSGETLGDEFVLARQTAVTSGRLVELRFYVLPDASGTQHFNAVQSYRVEESGRKTPLDNLRLLRANIVLSTDMASSHHLSTLLPNSPSQPVQGWIRTTVKGIDYPPAYKPQGCNYFGFQYQPDGSTDLNPTDQTAATDGGWFVTLVDSSSPTPSGQQPKNFYTWRVDTLTGRARLFRP